MPMVLLPECFREDDILDISIAGDEKEIEESRAAVSSMIKRL